MNKNEKTIPRLCSLDITTPDALEKSFEQIVISRLVPEKLSLLSEEIYKMRRGASRAPETVSTSVIKKIFTDANVDVENDEVVKIPLYGFFVVTQARRHTYPKHIIVWRDREYIIPMTPTFPGVDFIIIVGNVVIAFQMHLSEDQPNVLKILKKRAREANWKKPLIEKIILVYLSPKAETTRSLKAKIGRRGPSAKGKYVTLFYSVRDFDGLQDLEGKF